MGVTFSLFHHINDTTELSADVSVTGKQQKIAQSIGTLNFMNVNFKIAGRSEATSETYLFSPTP